MGELEVYSPTSSGHGAVAVVTVPPNHRRVEYSRCALMILVYWDALASNISIIINPCNVEKLLVVTVAKIQALPTRQRWQIQHLSPL